MVEALDYQFNKINPEFYITSERIGPSVLLDIIRDSVTLKKTSCLLGVSIDPTASFKMCWVGFHAFKSPVIQNALGWLPALVYINACRLIKSNTLVFFLPQDIKGIR